MSLIDNFNETKVTVDRNLIMGAAGQVFKGIDKNKTQFLDRSRVIRNNETKRRGRRCGANCM